MLRSTSHMGGAFFMYENVKKLLTSILIIDKF
jgi:hypothetical protein